MSGNDSRYFERFISVSLIYWAINILIEQLGRWIEQVLSIKDPKIVTQTLQEGGTSSMIRISQLSKSFSGQVVLDHLDLEVQKGEVVALIGSSGAGKSTFLRSLNYLETPDSGSIRLMTLKSIFLKLLKRKF